MACLARDPDPCEPLYSLPNKSVKAYQVWKPTVGSCVHAMKLPLADWSDSGVQRTVTWGEKQHRNWSLPCFMLLCAQTTIPTCSETHTPTQQMPAHPYPSGDSPLLQPAVQKKKMISWHHLGMSWAFSTYNGITPGSDIRSPNSEELEVSWTSRWLSLEEGLSD